MITISSLPFFSLPDNCFYNSHYNFFTAPQFKGVPVYAYIYLAIAIIICVAFFVSRILKREIDISRCLWAVTWIFCLGVIALQTSHQVWYLSTAQRNIGHMTDDERYSILYQYAYEVARTFASHVPPASSGRLVSDVKIGSDADVDALPYFMFPRLDVVHRDRKSDYLVFYLKNNMAAPVPGSFRPLVVDVNYPTQLWKRVDDDR